LGRKETELPFLQAKWVSKNPLPLTHAFPAETGFVNPSGLLCEEV
jgi:hypothetical protein